MRLKVTIVAFSLRRVKIVPTSSWTMEEKGRKHVKIVALDEKRQITAVGSTKAQHQLVYLR